MMNRKAKNKKRRKSEHGAVTVFLTIILVPCMVFTCIFGDLSRVQLSMATAESAGDLALYSLMSHYDEKLKEYYGLVASCQTIGSYYDVTAKYFTGMLQAEGVSDVGTQMFLDYLQELKTNGYADFLRCEITNAKVTAAQSGELGENAALIEDGIVEFMKYRGPIEITSNLIDRFSDLNLEKGTTEAEENKEVVDAKTEYAESQGELLEKAFYSYLAIRSYEKVQQQSHRPGQEAYDRLQQDLSDIRDDLRGVTNLIAKYYYPGTENLRALSIRFFTAEECAAQEAAEIGKETTDDDGNIHYYLSADTFNNLLDGLDSKLEEIRAAADGVVDDVNTQEVPTPGSDVNPVVYCMKMQEIITNRDLCRTLSAKGSDVLNIWAKMQGALNCEADPEDTGLPADWSAQLEAKCEEIKKVYDDYLSENANNDYTKLMKTYIETASDTVPKVQNKSYTFTSKFCGGNVTIQAFFGDVASKLPEMRSNLQEQIDRLNVAINGGTLNGHTVASLDELITEAQNFTQRRNDWGSAASRHDTEYAQSERALYENANAVAAGGSSNDEEVQGEAIAAQITPESVQELKTRLVNIRDDAQKCLDALDTFTYGGAGVENISGHDAAVQAARTVVPENNDFSEDAAESAARGYADNLISPTEGDVYKVPQKNNAVDGNNPDLSVATPKLYSYLKQQLQEKEDEVQSAVEDAKSKNSEYKKKAENAKENSTEVTKDYVTNKGENLTESHGGETLGVFSALGSAVSIAQNVANGHGDELRDQIYVCEYIMDMFSYSSFDNEGKYRLAKENGTVTYKDFPYSDQETVWSEDNVLEVMGNQSLTNRAINKDNNHANLGEVEYILYGNTDIDENLKTSYKNIFAIRETMNLVSGFCNFYTPTNATSNATAVSIAGIAGAIATATLGIVPIPVTKCVLITVLATLESAKDMQRLKSGAPVELYKSKPEQWVCSLEGIGKNAIEANLDKENDLTSAESGLYYSDYMRIFLLIGLTNSKTYSDMLLRVGDLIEANMRKTDAGENYDLSKAICYFNLTADIRVKPLMLSLGINDTIDGVSDFRARTDWCSYKVNQIRGYS